MSSQPPPGHTAASWRDNPNNPANYRPLNVRDALSYLDQVKIQFVEQPDVYNRFLDVMKEFKGQVIDTPGVIDRVSMLFRGHPALIQGFNTFLPPGYRIECFNEGDNRGLITVTTPTGTVSQVPGGFAAAIEKGERELREKAKTSPKRPTAVPIPPVQPVPASGPSTPSAVQVLTSAAERGGGNRHQMMEFNHAISFVNKIKTRFYGDPDTYKQFLEILQTYQKENREISDVYAQVTKLFSQAPDLIDEFKQFLPENGSGGFGGLGIGSFMQATVANDKVPQKRAKEVKDVAQKKRRTEPKRDTPEEDIANPQTLASPDEVAFFDKVKKFIDDKVTYHEFLKLINLFVQDMIDVKVLLDRAALFIGESGEVWTTFKKVVGADDVSHPFGGMIGVDAQLVENTPMLERVKPDLSGPMVKSYGPSYRKLPKSEINLTCTGRDPMCWEVLNDEWVSHPTWAAEDAAPFMAHKKNAYEEALHKSEEERHEYDYHIEANLRTIALLEPLYNRLQLMDPEERSHFNLKAGLGGQSKSIYQRIIKKVYGKELGPDIIRALHDNPVAALPIVLERLKAKDEEWKRAQREWNRVWREQDAKNFYKALDHQGVAFKTTDKKNTAAKALISEVEARRREFANTRRAFLDPNAVARSKNHFDFEFKDREVLKDVIKMVISYLDRVNNSLTDTDKERIERQLRDFIPIFFLFDQAEFDAEFGTAEPSSEESESDSDEEVKKPVDLRKQLLKQVGRIETPDEEDRGTPVPAPADPEIVAEAVEKDKAGAVASEQTWVQVEGPEDKPSRKGNFFTNSNFYVLMRLIEILYSRLLKCKEISAKLVTDNKQPVNPTAIRLGLAQPESTYLLPDSENNTEKYYGHLLAMSERLFENDIDVGTYEETLRYMFGTQAYILFTLDRLVAAIVKQIILGDVKSQELFALMERDRTSERTTTRQQIAYRMQAEGVVGDDHLFKIEYIPNTQTVSINLLQRDDLTIDDAETAEQKWRQYIESYVLTHATEGLPHRIEQPFLQRSLAELPANVPAEDFTVKSDMEIKIALGNYRMFFTPETEDFFHRRRSLTEIDRSNAAEDRFAEGAKLRLEAFVNK